MGSKSDNPELTIIEAPWNDTDGSRGYIFEVEGKLQKATFKTDASVGFDNANFGKKQDTTIGVNRTLLYGTFSFPVDLTESQTPQSELNEGQFIPCAAWYVYLLEQYSSSISPIAVRPQQSKPQDFREQC